MLKIIEQFINPSEKLSSSSSHTEHSGHSGSGTSGRIREWLKTLENSYFIIKGHIQSGKTIFMICMSNFLMAFGFTVVILLRNADADREQIYTRLTNFQTSHNKRYRKSFVCNKVAGPKLEKKNKAQLFICLGNESSVNHVLRVLTPKKYVLFIDEVDYVDSGDGKKSDPILTMKTQAYCTFGVSATVMDTIGKEFVIPKNLILLTTPSNYKGIFNHQINIVPNIIGSFSGVKSADLFETVHLEPFIQSYISRNDGHPFNFNGVYHPNICLINITRCVDPCMNAQHKISNMFPNVASIV